MRLAHFPGVLVPALLLFFAAAFLLPKEPVYALVFYMLVVPAVLVSRLPGIAWRDPALVLALVLIVWSGLTLIWGTDDGGRTARFLLSTVATAGFVLAMAAALPDAAARRRLSDVLVACGAANAVLSIALFLILQPKDPRLHGWGATIHPILGAAVMATAYLTALARGLAERKHRRANLAASVVMAVFILMTESRGPLLAGIISTLFLCAAGPWRWRAFAGLALLAAGWEALPSAVQHHSAAVLTQRGSSHRFEIWEYTARLIEDRPFFGHGLAANLHLNVGDEITFPHDLYLSLLFYSGFVGLLLFAALAVLLTRRLWRARREPEWPWLAALWLNLLVAGLTDLGQITKGPGPVWLIVWLPVGLLVSTKKAGGMASPRTPASVLEPGSVADSFYRAGG